jgi:uridylate kinase
MLNTLRFFPSSRLDLNLFQQNLCKVRDNLAFWRSQPPMGKVKYKRVMLKLSGEMLGGNRDGGIDHDSIFMLANEIAELHKTGVEVAVVIGGGNFFRGTQAASFAMERAAADYLGMLGTCINGLALQAVLENKLHIYTRVLTAIHMQEVAEPYICRKAVKHLQKNRIVIFAAGTGNPFFTTDTAASLRALEVGAEVILKATKVDGIYESDPIRNPNAKKFQELTYLDVIEKGLEVMDMTAITMCMEAKLPIIVFKMTGNRSIINALEDPRVGTLVR